MSSSSVGAPGAVIAKPPRRRLAGFREGGWQAMPFVLPALCILLGLATAVLATRVRYEAAFKAIIFVPMAISATAVAVIWRFVYSPDRDLGVLNATLGVFGGD